MSGRAPLSAVGNRRLAFFRCVAQNPPVSESDARRRREPSGTIETDEKTRALKQAAEALERGDFGLARRVMTGIEGKRAAVLRERLRADRLVLWLIIACLILFGVVVATTVRRP